MTKPANPAFSISQPDLTSALAQIGAQIDHQPLRSSAFARIIRETFHGSDAGGAWDWRIAYALMQAAAIQVLLRGDGAAGDIATAKLLASRLLTETRRSEQQIRLQFSTPLPFAALVLPAAAIRKGETVLEPSAGTGALAAFATRAGAMLFLNEIHPFRQRLLRALFGGEVTGHDGEHIGDLLQALVLPDVVVMNLPFASSVDRSRDKHIAAMRRIADQSERVRAAGTLDLGFETLRGEKIEQVSTEVLWTCPKSGAVTRIIGLEVTDPVHVLSEDDALSRNPDKLAMVNRGSGRAALISARPMQMYDEDIVTLMRKAVRPNGSSYLEETRFGSSAREEIGKPEFARLWDADAAELRARFLISNPQTPQEMLTAVLGTTAPVDLGRGLTLTRCRVAGEMRLELCGADKDMIEGLKALGCFTEIIAFQLRVFLPHGDGIDTGGILARIVGQQPDAASVAAE